MADLTEVADELYGLTPDDFTAARNERARQLSDPAVRALARPSTAAWAVNLLVRHRTERIDAVIELGEKLRAAQRDLDSGALRSLTASRRAITSELVADAGKLAAEHGRRLPAGAVVEVNQTLQAAMADRWAATAVRSGRLVRALASVGFEPVDLEGAVAVAGEAPAAASAPPADAEVARRRAEAEQDAAEAEEAEEEAERALATAAAVAAESARRREAVADRVATLRVELETLRTDLDILERDAARAQREHEAAGAAAAAARRRAESARKKTTP